MIEELNRESLKVDLKMNMKKTKVKFNNQLAEQQIMIESGRIHILGTNSANPAHDRKIKGRIGIKWTAFGKQGDIMNSNLPLSLKKKVYNQCILPVLTYGSETWHLTKEEERKQRGMEMKMLDITWRDRRRATWIRKQTKVENILITIKKRNTLGRAILCTEQTTDEHRR